MILLDQLLAATPLPPEDASVDELLAAFEAMAVGRQAIIDQIREPLPVHSHGDRAAVLELSLRQEAWAHALAAAHGSVCDQLVGNTKVRAYAQAL